MPPGTEGVADDSERKSARSIRKAKAKANAKKRAAARNVVNPHDGLDVDDKPEDRVGGEGEAKPTNADKAEGNKTTTEDDRPTTSHSNVSEDTLVGGAHDSGAATPALAAPSAPAVENDGNGPKTTSREWTYDPLPDLTPPSTTLRDRDDDGEVPEEPLTEAEIRHKEIESWLLEQPGHQYSLKRSTVEKIADFVYTMKYEEDRGARMKEVRLHVWKAAVRSSFWWTNPDTGLAVGKPEPITAPTGAFESNFPIFVACAAERLDRIGRDLPDPEYVAQVEGALRLFFRRAAYRGIVRPLEQLAFLLMIDEEQGRFVTREGLQARLRLCFDRVKAMEWSGMGIVSMGEWPTRKTDPPLRYNVVWADLVKRFEL